MVFKKKSKDQKIKNLTENTAIYILSKTRIIIIKMIDKNG